MRIAVYTNILRVTVLARRCAADMEEPEVRVCAVDGMDRWEEMRAAADLHLFLWMGTGLDNDFLKQASRDLQKHRMLHLYHVPCIFKSCGIYIFAVIFHICMTRNFSQNSLIISSD